MCEYLDVSASSSCFSDYQMDSLSSYRNKIHDLSEAEQFAVVVSKLFDVCKCEMKCLVVLWQLVLFAPSYLALFIVSITT